MIDLPPDCQAALRDPVMQQIYQVESEFNPFAIGVVGGRLVRQPKNLAEAVATADYLTNLGRNFSIGQGQVNKTHFVRLGWDSDIKAGFDVCKTLWQHTRFFNNASPGRSVLDSMQHKNTVQPMRP